ncbi:MAG: hypothetical protein ACE5LH_03695 [Fidelibacterota bacterium]
MKILLSLLAVWTVSRGAPFRHHIVFLGGETEPGRVVAMTEDRVKFQPLGQETVREVLLDSVLYIHNGEGKLFFVSEKLETFLERARGRGGRLVTVSGYEIAYGALRPQLFMYNPTISFAVSGLEGWVNIPLESIHRIEVDRSLSEFAVRKGFYVGAGISVIRFLIKFKSIRQLGRAPEYASEVYPGLVTLTPLVTLGWIVYDYFYGKRELTINSRRFQ